MRISLSLRNAEMVNQEGRMMSSSRTFGGKRRPFVTSLFGGGLLAILAFAGGFVATLLFSVSSFSVLPGLIGGFAVFGAWWAISMIWRGAHESAPEQDLLGPTAIAAASDAMALVEDGEQVVEVNAAYRELCRSASGQPPIPEHFLARVPGTQAAVSELLAAVAKGETLTRIIRADSGMRGRQMEISVYPIGGSPKRVLWDLRLVGPVIEAAGEVGKVPAPAPAPVVASAVVRAAPLAAPVPASVSAPAPIATSTPVPAPASVVRAPVEATVPVPSGPVSAETSGLLAAWEMAPAGVARFGRTHVRLANAGMCRLLGYGLAEWGTDGMSLQDVVVPEQVETLRAALQPGAKPASFSLSLLRKDGNDLPVFMRLGMVDASGEATAVVLPQVVLPQAVQPAAGVAPRAVAPVPVAAAPAVVRAAPVVKPVSAGAVDAVADQFFQRAPLALAVVDAGGQIRAANEAFARLFGESYAKAGIALATTVAEQDAAAVEAFLSSARAGTQGGAFSEVVVTTGTGGRSARLYGAPLAIAGEVALCAMETTEQKALEAQYAQSQRLQAVGHLAGGVAHDFNNVLTAIIGYCDLLLARHRPSDPSFPDIMQIKQNANRAAALVRQLLAFSRRQTLRPQVIELTDVISDVSELLRRLIGERITLEVQHARELWPVKVDVNQFEQVIVNLVVNARDAMPNGGTLTLRTANVPAFACAGYGQRLAEGDYVLVEVEDTGTGIPADIIDKIFEPFFSTKEVGKGTGLGLSTVYGIVEQTGGTIQAANVEGRGAAFRVFLPRHVPGVEDEAPKALEPEVKVGDSTGHGCVLLVEDEDAVRAFASRALAGRGYEVLTAASGVEAMEVMARFGKKVDLVISDVVMPEMDGPSLLRELRARDPALKVIFISGYAEEAFAKNLPPDEHFSFLPKPFSLKQLVGAVNTAMRGTE